MACPSSVYEDSPHPFVGPDNATANVDGTVRALSSSDYSSVRSMRARTPARLAPGRAAPVGRSVQLRPWRRRQSSRDTPRRKAETKAE